MTKHNKFFNNNRNNNRDHNDRDSNNRAPAQHEDTDENVEEVPRPDLALGAQRGFQRGSAGNVNLTISGSAEGISNMLAMIRTTPRAPQPMYHFGSGNGPASTFQAPYQQDQPRDILAATGQRGGPSNNRGRGGRGRGRGNHNMSRPASSGRNNAEQSTASNALVLLKGPKPCANCEREGHRILRCVGPPNHWGFIPGCPWCNVLDHIWEECSEFPRDDDVKIGKYLLEMRANLPPLMSSVAVSEIPAGHPGGIYHGNVPWTTAFSLDFWKRNPDYWKDYVYNRDRKDDVVLATCDWNNPEHVGTLANAMPKEAIRQGIQASRIGGHKSKSRTFNSEEQNPKRQKPNKEDEEMNDPAPHGGQTELPNRPALQNLGAPTSRMDTPINSLIGSLGPNVATVPHKNGSVTIGMIGPGGWQMGQKGQKGGLEPCTNCGGDHRPADCHSPCGGCGEPGHKRLDCPKINVICVCSKYPGHLLEACKVLCTQVCAANVQQQAHMLVNCSRCAKCGLNHPVLSCVAKNGVYCLRCSSNYGARYDGKHLSFEHPKAHPTDSKIHCPNRPCDRYYCNQHCQRCAISISSHSNTEVCKSQLLNEGGHEYMICEYQHNKVVAGSDCQACIEMKKNQ